MMGSLPDERHESREATHDWVREFVHDSAYAHGLADDVFDLLTELAVVKATIERQQAEARRVEYAWENLRGWMPNGRGVKNWTAEMSRAVAALSVGEEQETR